MNGTLLSILVTNQFGVLTKITGLFSRRGFNIKALSVGETEDPSLSRITVLTEGDELKLNQIYTQVSKLEDVKAAALLTSEETLECGLALVKIDPADKMAELRDLAKIQGAEVVAISGGRVIVKVFGTMDEIEDTISKLKNYTIVEMSRTGPTALDTREYSLTNQRRNWQ